MSDLGRILIGLGILLVIVGVFFVISSRLNLPLGRLPGDFSWRGKGWAVSFPLASSLVISVVLSLLFWLFGHFRR
jgi:ribose/xylose/arabinose/galactoside ABC-type transport system permease subunit